jgi:hypothetical protein
MSRAQHFVADRRGGVAFFFSLSLLPLMAIAGAGFDLLTMSKLRSQLQAAAEAGALRAAQELRLAEIGNYDVTPFAESAAREALAKATRALASIDVTASLADANSAVQVNVSGVFEPKFIHFVYKQSITLAARAIARTRGFPICILALEDDASGAIDLRENAKVSARSCLVQSNSRNPQGLSASHNATLEAAMICSSGGKSTSSGKLNPEPLTDCPIVTDPLANRLAPDVSRCDRQNTVISSGSVSLEPGVYCGGLKVTNGAAASLSAGEYIIKDGPLVIDGGAEITALGVGFYLTGKDAVLKFSRDSTVAMTAPPSGPLAGILFFEDRAAPLLRAHEILSNRTSHLRGALYLPRGLLRIGATGSDSHASFTIMISRQIQVDRDADLKSDDDRATDFPGASDAKSRDAVVRK